MTTKLRPEHDRAAFDHDIARTTEVADHWWESACKCGWISDTRWLRSQAVLLWIDHTETQGQ